MLLPKGPVFTRADTLETGITGAQLKALVGAGAVVRLRRDTYCATRLRDDLATTATGLQVLAVLAAQARVRAPTWATGLTAAALHRLALPYQAPDLISLVADTGTTSPRCYRDMTVQVARVPDHHRAALMRVPIVTLARALVDIAREHDLASALVVGDDALRRGDLDEAALRLALDDCAGMPGMVAARAAIAQLDGIRETPIESESWAFFLDEGIALPRCQQWIGGDRVDFLWPQARLVGEADGKVKYDLGADADQGDALWREKVRAERIEDDDYDVVRWTFTDLRRRRASLARRLRRYL